MSPKITAAVAALSILLLTACSTKPVAPASPSASPEPAPAVTNPPPGAPLPPEQVDVVTRKILEGYIDALSREAYAEAAGYWSPAASVTPPSGETLKVAGVSGWHVESTELIHSTDTTAYVQLNFTVKVTGNNTGYSDGRNVRYVQLVKQDGAWKIVSMAKNAVM